jgi:hypothetical protein
MCNSISIKNCKCDEFYNMRKNSCARAYLFEGGCNSCNPYYTDLKGEAETFPEEFENKVTSIMVKEGCQLTIYDEVDFEGESVNVEGIQQVGMKCYFRIVFAKRYVFIAHVVTI